MELKIINKNFSVCKIENIEQVNFSDQFCFAGKTDEEISLVCSTDCVPAHTIERDDGCRAFRIQGTLDFGLIGILSKISVILADNGISIFAVSTYNTDYVLIKENNFNRAIEALEGQGYTVI